MESTLLGARHGSGGNTIPWSTLWMVVALWSTVRASQLPPLGSRGWRSPSLSPPRFLRQRMLKSGVAVWRPRQGLDVWPSKRKGGCDEECNGAINLAAAKAKVLQSTDEGQGVDVRERPAKGHVSLSPETPAGGQVGPALLHIRLTSKGTWQLPRAYRQGARELY